VALARIRQAPVTVPTLLAVAILLAWAPLNGAQPITRWAPGALGVLALVALAAAVAPLRWRDVPLAVRVAVLLLGAFTVWSALSIAWADDQGAALEGADRTLLYLAVFALFALWPQRTVTAAWVLGAWALGLGVLAVVTLVRVGVMSDPSALFNGDRLMWPAGYENAAAAMFLMPLWPAVTLAASPRVPWLLRGLFAAVAVVLVDVALLAQSRGSILALPACVVLLILLVPGRLRHLAVLVPILGAAGAALPMVLDVGPALLARNAGDLSSATQNVLVAVLLAAFAAGLLVAAVAAWETLRPPSGATAARLRRGWTVVVVGTAVVGAVGGLAVIGNPVTRIDDAWSSFKGGYADDAASSNRLVSGLGSNRYDFYRVALDLFAEHPVAGIGADNYFQDYLARGASKETPRYPHDLPLRTLSQTGLVGGLLLLGAVVAALVAAWRAMRRADPLSAAVAGGAAMAFIYWIAHGVTDWFWEWAGLGAPAFAFLGLACALAARGGTVGEEDDATAVAAAVAPPRLRPIVVLPVGAVLVLGALAIAGPWLAERDVERAGAVFATRPMEAYARLDRASALDPLSDRPALVKGSIALRFGDLVRARSAFGDAVARNARGQYATLELGAIAAAQGRPAEARRLLERAVALAPRDPTAREALGIVRTGGVVDIAALNQRIYRAGKNFAGA
jgi:tetratricopeptide (TPR) repeat protein